MPIVSNGTTKAWSPTHFFNKDIRKTGCADVNSMGKYKIIGNIANAHHNPIKTNISGSKLPLFFMSEIFI